MPPRFAFSANAFRRGKIFALLELIRFPNLFTAMADSFAGVLVVAGSGAAPATLGLLTTASACLYGAGCAANDIHDRELDRLERPARPLPSGRVSLAEAWAVTLVLMAMGLGAAALAGCRCLAAALVLCGLILAYDFLLKDHPLLGPLSMGACRGVNLLMGLSAGSIQGFLYLLPLIHLLHVFAATTISQGETGTITGTTGYATGTAAAAVLLLLGFLVTGIFAPAGMIFFLAYLAFWLPLFVMATAAATTAGRSRAIARVRDTSTIRSVGRSCAFPGARDTSSIRSVVSAMVLALPLLDGLYVAGTAGPVPGLITVLWLVPAIVLAKRFYVT